MILQNNLLENDQRYEQAFIHLAFRPRLAQDFDPDPESMISSQWTQWNIQAAASH